MLQKGSASNLKTVIASPNPKQKMHCIFFSIIAFFYFFIFPKTQFQSKLEELTLLPDLINKTNQKLKETEELKTTAEKNCVILSMNLDDVIEEVS